MGARGDEGDEGVGGQGGQGGQGGIIEQVSPLSLLHAQFPILRLRSVQVPNSQCPIIYYSVLSGKIPLICSRFNTVAKSVSLINPRSRTICRRDLPVSKDSLATAAAFK